MEATTPSKAGMKNKTIKLKIKKKLDDWIDSIDCEDTRDIVKKNAIVTGGSIASMAMGDQVNDYDIYMRTKEATVALAEYYISKGEGLTASEMKVEVGEVENIKGESEERVRVVIESSGVASEAPEEECFDEDILEPFDDEDEGEKYRPVFISENAITLSHSVQIITRFFGEPDKIHDNFDFIHAMCYYDLSKNSLSMPIEAVRSMQSKSLYYKGSLYPLCSLFRMRKFIKRGWKISAGEILKIAMQISVIDLKDRKILREQLTGVDQLYFNYLYDAIDSIEGDITDTYVAEIIDRIFGDHNC